MSEKKWTYWYYVIDVNKDVDSSYKKNSCIGYSDLMEDTLYTADDAIQGFVWSARIKFLVKLPHNLEKEDPERAINELDKAMVLKGFKLDAEI